MAHRYPDTAVFYRKLNRTYPKAVRGDGCYLFDETGKRYLDGSGGAYVANLGHGLTEMADRVAEQVRDVAYVTSGTGGTPLCAICHATATYTSAGGGGSSAWGTNTYKQGTTKNENTGHAWSMPGNMTSNTTRSGG